MNQKEAVVMKDARDALYKYVDFLMGIQDGGDKGRSLKVLTIIAKMDCYIEAADEKGSRKAKEVMCSVPGCGKTMYEHEAGKTVEYYCKDHLKLDHHGIPVVNINDANTMTLSEFITKMGPTSEPYKVKVPLETTKKLNTAYWEGYEDGKKGVLPADKRKKETEMAERLNRAYWDGVEYGKKMAAGGRAVVVFEKGSGTRFEVVREGAYAFDVKIPGGKRRIEKSKVDVVWREPSCKDDGFDVRERESGHQTIRCRRCGHEWWLHEKWSGRTLVVGCLKCGQQGSYSEDEIRDKLARRLEDDGNCNTGKIPGMTTEEILWRYMLNDPRQKKILDALINLVEQIRMTVNNLANRVCKEGGDYEELMRGIRDAQTKLAKAKGPRMEGCPKCKGIMADGICSACGYDVSKPEPPEKPGKPATREDMKEMWGKKAKTYVFNQTFAEIVPHLIERWYVTRKLWKGNAVLVFGMDNGPDMMTRASRSKRAWYPSLSDIKAADWIVLPYVWTCGKDDFLPFDEEDETLQQMSMDGRYVDGIKKMKGVASAEMVHKKEEIEKPCMFYDVIKTVRPDLDEAMEITKRAGDFMAPEVLKAAAFKFRRAVVSMADSTAALVGNLVSMQMTHERRKRSHDFVDEMKKISDLVKDGEDR